MVDSHRIAQISKEQTSSSVEERVRDAKEYFTERRECLVALRGQLERLYDESDPIVDEYLHVVLLILDGLGARFGQSYLDLTGFDPATDERLFPSPLPKAMAHARANSKYPQRIKDSWQRAAIGAARAYAETAGVAADVRRAMQDATCEGRDVSLWAGIEAWLSCIEEFTDIDLWIVSGGRERYPGHLEQAAIDVAGLAITQTSLRENKRLNHALGGMYDGSGHDALYQEMPSAIFEALRADRAAGQPDLKDARNRAANIIAQTMIEKQWEIIGSGEKIVTSKEAESSASSPADHLVAQDEYRTILERSQLSPREREIVLLRAKGLQGKEIAELLHIAHSTVRVTVARATKKIKATQESDRFM